MCHVRTSLYAYIAPIFSFDINVIHSSERDGQIVV